MAALTTLALSARLHVNRPSNAQDFAPRALWRFRARSAAALTIGEGGGDRIGPGGAPEHGGGGKVVRPWDLVLSSSDRASLSTIGQEEAWSQV
jgi:hypothetical protein